MKQANYWWLVDVDLGGYVYDGCVREHGKPNKYILTKYEHGKPVEQMSLGHKEFKEYIVQYDLSEYKRTAR